MREVIVATVGSIGMPEGEYCVDSLIKLLSSNNEDANVKAMAMWALGRLPTQDTALKARKVIISGLRDSYWKVRAATCTAIAQLGEPVAQVTIPILTKILREGLVNR